MRKILGALLATLVFGLSTSGAFASEGAHHHHQQHRHLGAGWVEAHQFLGHNDMGGTGNRQQLARALDNGENKNL